MEVRYCTSIEDYDSENTFKFKTLLNSPALHLLVTRLQSHLLSQEHVERNTRRHLDRTLTPHFVIWEKLTNTPLSESCEAKTFFFLSSHCPAFRPKCPCKSQRIPRRNFKITLSPKRAWSNTSVPPLLGSRIPQRNIGSSLR